MNFHDAYTTRHKPKAKRKQIKEIGGEKRELPKELPMYQFGSPCGMSLFSVHEAKGIVPGTNQKRK